MRTLNPFLLLLFAVGLAFGGPGMRMAAASGGQAIVICSAGGALSVRIGPDGKPVRTRDLDCRSCCLGLAADLPADAGHPLPPAAVTAARRTAETGRDAGHVYRVPEARAPPVTL